MTLDELISEVLELDEKATKGPWTRNILGKITILNERENLTNHELIYHYRTSAPELARRCKIMKEALHLVLERYGHNPKIMEPEEIFTARAALAYIDEEKK